MTVRLRLIPTVTWTATCRAAKKKLLGAALPQAKKITELVTRKGVTRRSFLKFCGIMAATLGLEATHIPKIAEALTSGPRPPFIWLQFAECTGCTEAFLRSSSPFIDDLLLNKISLEYHETLMAPSGAAATKSLEDAVSKYSGKYFVITEGAIPVANSGNYGMIGGRTMLNIAQDVCSQAQMMISLGTCAAFGGLPAAKGNLTGADCVHGALSGIQTIKMPGCPPNPVRTSRPPTSSTAVTTSVCATRQATVPSGSMAKVSSSDIAAHSTLAPAV